MKAILLKLLLSFILFTLIAETGTRLLFWHGASFSTRGGPIVRRFERNFALNDFDRSRGPVVSGPKQQGTVRVLVQGDSITWGQGISAEEEIYPARLLEMLRQHDAPVEMLVLARPGREIDGHYEQIVKYGASTQPDVIIYQWYVNDLQVRKQPRNREHERIWRRLPFAGTLVRRSYFFFFLDYRLNQILPQSARGYEAVFLETFGGDTPEWRAFAEVFRKWASKAKGLTPRVVMVLYPDLLSTEGDRLSVLYEKVTGLSRDTGVEVIDLRDTFADLQGDSAAVSVSRYDAHPNSMVHGRMADSVYAGVTSLWPELWAAE